jgi:hypothetical protein
MPFPFSQSYETPNMSGSSSQTAADLESHPITPRNESNPFTIPPNGEKLPKPCDPMSSRTEGGVEYKSMVWWQAGMVMVAETISLGILSLPAAMAVLGIVPGLILLLCLGLMATYSGLVIGQFKLRYLHIHSFGCAGEILFGKVGVIIGWAQFAFYVFIMGSHILTFSIMSVLVLASNPRCVN